MYLKFRYNVAPLTSLPGGVPLLCFPIARYLCFRVAPIGRSDDFFNLSPAQSWDEAGVF